MRMATHALRWSVVFVAVSACGPQVDTCGAGTTLQNGVCVADATDTRCGEGTLLNPETFECEPLTACGEGTVLMGGVCEPEAECGPGTFLDLATNTCTPDVVCGPGTYADPDTHVCLPVRTCGAGTTFNPLTDDCEADFPCAPGATLNPDSGLCESTLACGPGQVLFDGQCVGPNQGLALGADFVESTPDHNDPLYGGTPEMVTLADDGETVLTGVIGRPADVAGNGTLTQDRDVWAFEGQSGGYYRIEVLSLGLPAPVFTLEGPGEYLRSSSVGYEAEAKREVILPRDGRYELTVVPSAFLTSGVPLGDPEAGYVIRITEIATPGVPNHNPGADFLNPTSIDFNLKNLSDNFFGIETFTGAAVLLTFENVSAETLPSVLVFNSQWQLVSERQVIEEDDFVGVYVKGLGEATVVLDWRTSTGPVDDITVNMHIVPLVNRGAVQPDASSSTDTLDVSGFTAGAYRITTAARQVVSVDIHGTGLFNPDVQVVGPGGSRALVLDDDEFFFLADNGEYVFFVFNDSPADDTGVGIVMTLQTPYDLGALDLAANPTGTVAGDDLVYGFDGFERAFLVVEAPVSSMLGFDLDILAGDPDIAVYSIDGVQLRRVHRPQLDRPLYIVNRDPRPLLIELDADDHALLDWSLTATVHELPIFRDIEPNDVKQNAVPLGGELAQFRGFIDDDEIDVYSFELLDQLEPHQSLRVHFDNMESDNGFGFITDGVAVRVLDQNFLPLSSIPDPDSAPGTLGVNTSTYVASYHGPGLYHIEVYGQFITTESPYVITLDVADVPVEVEPNNDLSDADHMGPLPASVIGYREEGGGDDVFTFDLPASLGPDESLWVTARNFENANDLDVTVQSADGTVVGYHEAELNVVHVPDLPAGVYTVIVSGSSGGEFVYQVDVDTGPGTESEPNGTGFAEDLGEVDLDLGHEVYGYATDADDDVWTFALAAPLSEDSSLRLSVINVDDNSQNLVRLYDGPDPDTANLLAVDESATSFLVDALPVGSTGPFSVVVTGAGSGQDRYRLKLQAGGRCEREPNQDAASSNGFVVPGAIYGMVRPGDADVYEVVVDGTEDYRLRMENLSDGSNIRVTLRDESFAELYTGQGFRVWVNITPPGAGTYYVEISQDGAESDASDEYILDVNVLD